MQIEQLGHVVGRHTSHPALGADAPLALAWGFRQRGVVDRVREAGWDTVGEIVDFENTFLLCYIRGPEGLIVELAERLDGARG